MGWKWDGMESNRMEMTWNGKEMEWNSLRFLAVLYTETDETLQLVKRYIKEGWPSKMKDKKLLAFASC